PGHHAPVWIRAFGRLHGLAFGPPPLEERSGPPVRGDGGRIGLAERDPAGRKLDAEGARDRRLEQLVLDAESGEHVARGELNARRELDKPVQLEQLGPGLLLELAPARERLLCERDPGRVRVREPEDPRAPVARAARRARLELLVERDVGATLGERPGGGTAHHARPDDCDYWSCQAISNRNVSPGPLSRISRGGKANSRPCSCAHRATAS